MLQRLGVSSLLGLVAIAAVAQLAPAQNPNDGRPYIPVGPPRTYCTGTDCASGQKAGNRGSGSRGGRGGNRGPGRAGESSSGRSSTGPRRPAVAARSGGRSTGPPRGPAQPVSPTGTAAETPTEPEGPSQASQDLLAMVDDKVKSAETLKDFLAAGPIADFLRGLGGGPATVAKTEWDALGTAFENVDKGTRGIIAERIDQTLATDAVGQVISGRSKFKAKERAAWSKFSEVVKGGRSHTAPETRPPN